ncbi:hypothetical protein AMECASPLE_033309 [Ameca splendens]|uniref:Uncharacterized protein n=1 Tax=Ameca splendens TaxID=208324 RepID=A0ABV0YIK5_9TELE
MAKSLARYSCRQSGLRFKRQTRRFTMSLPTTGGEVGHPNPVPGKRSFSSTASTCVPQQELESQDPSMSTGSMGKGSDDEHPSPVSMEILASVLPQSRQTL